MAEKYFTVVIGGGPGGTPAAMALAAAGRKVLLVEASGRLGGACLFVGCIPSKIIKYTSDEINTFKKTAAKFGIEGYVKPEKAWDYIQKKMDMILNRRSDKAMEKAQQIPGLTIIEGKASFTSVNSVKIITPDGEEISADFEKAIIATGSKSWVPPFSGDGVKDILVTEDFFRMEKLPKSLAIIGFGPIGIELGQMLSQLGVRVTAIESMSSLLEGIVENDFSDIISQNLQKMGITVKLSSKVQRIDKDYDGFKLGISSDDGSVQDISVEKVLVVTGKIPNIDGLGLDVIKLESDNKGIKVNDFLETSIPGIYATGDVNTGPKYAHVASKEAQIAVRNILAGNKLKVDFNKNSWVLFSEPEVAVAGLTEVQAENTGVEIIKGTYNYKIDASAQINENAGGLLRFIVNKKTQSILGVHILGLGASELIGEAALIVAKGLTLSDVAGAIHPHPTLTEAFGVLAGQMIQQQKK